MSSSNIACWALFFSIVRRIYLLTFFYFFTAAVTLAANVEIVENVTLEASGRSFTIKSSSLMDSFRVNASSFEFTLSGRQSVEITSADRRLFTVSPEISDTFTCTAALSTLKLERRDGEPQVTVTVTPSANPCALGGGGLAGGGGGLAGSGIVTQTPVPSPLTLPVIQPSPPIVGVVFLEDLALGVQNGDVRKLQELLAQDPSIYPEGLVTGYFGSLTQAAVKRFQTKYGLPPSGRVGPLTRAKLNEIFGKEKPGVPSAPPSAAPSPEKLSPLGITRSLRLKTFNDEVKILQQLLAQDKEIYPEGLVTGYFGSLTRAAVQRFQAKYGIVDSGDENSTGLGLVGPRTRIKLQEIYGR